MAPTEQLAAKERVVMHGVVLVLWTIGAVLLVPELSWRTLAGLFFVIWANNLQVRTR